VPEGQIWLILLAASLCVNIVQLLWRPILRFLRRGDQVSEDNIRAMVEEGEESGAIQGSEKEFIENVFDFDNLTAKDVMVHRTDMVTIALDDSEEEILEAILKRHVTDHDGRLHLGHTCEVAGLGPRHERNGSVEYYLSEPVVEDDPKAQGVLMMTYGEYLLSGHGEP